MRNEGANRRETVDEIIKALTSKDVDINSVQSSLMKSYRVLDNNSHQEKEALKEVLASNVLLAKSVGLLLTRVVHLENDKKVLEGRVRKLETDISILKSRR